MIYFKCGEWLPPEGTVEETTPVSDPEPITTDPIDEDETTPNDGG